VAFDWTGGIARSLRYLPFAIQDKVRTAIANLDRVTLETLPLSDELRSRVLLIIMDLAVAQPLIICKNLVLDRLQQRSAQPSQISDFVTQISAIAAVESISTKSPFILDLGLIQTIDYYTGIVFEVVGETGRLSAVLGQGSRYDQLLELYHPKTNSPDWICTQHRRLRILVSTNQLPPANPNCWLVVPEAPEAYIAAFTYAEKLQKFSHFGASKRI